MRNKIITIFVICWLVVFHYESTRYYYLQPLLQKDLPKTKFLFPPAGWIMFYNVDNNYGYAEVYGVKNGVPQPIDPHTILQTRPIGYDNIHRNALISVLTGEMRQSFCDYLKRKFNYFDSFLITYVSHSNLTERPFERRQDIAYECK